MYYTLETLSNHVFEDLWKPKAHNNLSRGVGVHEGTGELEGMDTRVQAQKQHEHAHRDP
jgi:hypothetical protein